MQNFVALLATSWGAEVKKVKSALEQATKAKRESRYIDLLFI
jgi:hypothetical protein